MTDPVGELNVVGTGAAGDGGGSTDQALVKDSPREGVGATSADVNNNKGDEAGEREITGRTNHPGGATSGGNKNMAEANQGKPANGVVNGATADNVKENGDNVNNDVLRVNTEVQEDVQEELDLAGQDPEEIDQFDSASNAVSQHGRHDTRPSVSRREASMHIPHPGDEKARTSVTPGQPAAQKPKKIKKGIFVSYSPDAGFMERRFVVETVRQLKENNLADDIWFDKDEENTGSPCWFSLRMEAVERCRAGIMFMSDSYFTCPVSVYEGKALLERVKVDPHSVAIFPILFSPIEKVEPNKGFLPLIKQSVDLTGEHSKLSIAEKSSVVIGTIMETLEKFACMNLPMQISSIDSEFTGNFKRKKICTWDASDLQEWMYKLGIKEFYRQSLAENMVDGFLLMSLTDHDMVNHLGIDSRVVRKKIMQSILQTLDKEHKQLDNWHLRARSQRPKPDTVYLVYDPADVRLAQNLKIDLKKKNVQVIHHDSLKLGKSKEEFLEINGPQMATASHVIVLVTEASANSPFVFHEVLFADWLGKKLVSAVFKNIWFSFRPALKAILGDCPAIDFETKMYPESLDVLENHVKPLRRVPGVVLEQAYLNKMAEGLKPLEALAYSKNGRQYDHVIDGEPKVFISYQWDMQAKVEDIKHMLENSGLDCWADINMAPQPNRGSSSKSGRSSTSTHDSAPENLQSLIQRTMKSSSVVVSCITPKYLQSDNCKKDLMLAETFKKPIIPVLLRFSPLESAPDQIRKILNRLSYIDLSNERLYKQNIGFVVERIKKHVTMK